MPSDSPASDIDSLDLLEASEGWALVKARIEQEIERGRDTLEQADWDINRLNCTRGMVSALRTVLSLPDILRGELKEQLKEQDV